MRAKKFGEIAETADAWRARKRNKEINAMDHNLVIVVSSVVTAFATVVYTIGTFLLWRSTQKALEETRDAFKLNLLMAVQQIKLSTRDVSDPNHLTMLAAIQFRTEGLDILKRVFPDEYESLFGK